MIFEGVLTKMQTEFQNPIQYFLVFDSSFIHVNDILNKTISLEVIGYQCLECSKEKKIFRQGFCFDCFTKSPSAGDWIMKPELSKAHLEIEDRDLEYEKKIQLQPHFVYLAKSSDIKVGVTRKSQIPTRWIDQGATEALTVLEVPNRYLAGITEVALKKYFVDKTNWQKMLKNEISETSLLVAKEKIYDALPQEVLDYYDNNSSKVISLYYPVIQYPTKVISLNLEKEKKYKGKLVGIKGQYLLFEDGTVFNVRTYEGYKVMINL